MDVYPKEMQNREDAAISPPASDRVPDDAAPIIALARLLARQATRDLLHRPSHPNAGETVDDA